MRPDFATDWRDQVRNQESLKLPLLPDPIETQLFFQGREAWTYSWDLLNQDAQKPLYRISVKVDVKLKREFCQYQLRQRYTFLCKLELQPDIYSPIKSIHEKSV